MNVFDVAAMVVSLCSVAVVAIAARRVRRTAIQARRQLTLALTTHDQAAMLREAVDHGNATLTVQIDQLKHQRELLAAESAPCDLPALDQWETVITAPCQLRKGHEGDCAYRLADVPMLGYVRAPF